MRIMCRLCRRWVPAHEDASHAAQCTGKVTRHGVRKESDGARREDLRRHRLARDEAALLSRATVVEPELPTYTDYRFPRR